jgi:hypothetical protein
MYRTLVPENEIDIWPRRLSSPPGGKLEYSMITIAETIVKIYAPQVKSIDQRCREAPIEYKMKDQAVEEKFIIQYIQSSEGLHLQARNRRGNAFPEVTGVGSIYAFRNPVRPDESHRGA